MLVSAVCIGIVIIIWCFYKNSIYKSNWREIMKMPGPPVVPFIGNLMFVLKLRPDSLFENDRERAQKYYPIYKIVFLNVLYVCVISPEDIELVLSNSKHNTKGDLYKFLHGWLGNGLLTSDGSLWQTRRKILTPAFHFSILREFINIFNREASDLVEQIERDCHQPYIDVVKPITEFTLCSIGETSLGVNLKSGSSSHEYKNTILGYNRILTDRVIKPWLHSDQIYSMTSDSKKIKKYVNILHRFSKRVIEERKLLFSSPKSYAMKKKLAMLDLLLKAKYDGIDIDDEGIREEVDTFMFEGHDTTSVAICYTLMVLANEEKYQEDIRREIMDILGDSNDFPTYTQLMEMKFMERCIKECLRLFPSVPFIQRVSGEDIKTHSGYIIPKETNINIYIFDMHRNPSVWENPLVFDPDRFLPENITARHPFAYLPFSAGPRNCIGQRFAILEIKAALCALLQKFKLEPIDRPENQQFKSDMVLRPVGEIRVKFVPL